MYSVLTFLQYATLLFLSAGVSLASVDARAACKVDTYGPFKLYASSSGPDGTSLLHLIDMTVDDNNNTISTLTTCDTCGKTPVHWVLKNSVLSPVFSPPSPREVVDLVLPFGKVNFINDKRQGAPIYCAEKNSTSSSAIPKLISANSHTDLFSICSFIGTPGPAHRRDVYYNQTSSGIATNCQPAQLTIELV
ncbi:hypothetical protein CPB86DRAFT_718942 [Serendipita vermifera]|nr:hypothetical protein CPB86DRAFT_718942 [Serendipita vermifera]